MIASPARQLANVANAQKSTGPKTEEGKARSRCNAYKHGMAGNGVVLSPEDAAEVALRVAELTAELRPSSRLGSILVHRVASASLQLERAAVKESNHVAERVRHARVAHGETMQAQAEALLDELAENPATAARRLRRTPEGIEVALRTWLELRDDLMRAGSDAWTVQHAERAVHLSGRRFDEVPNPPMKRFALAALGDFRLLGRLEGERLDDEGRRDWASARLAELIDAEVAALRAAFDTLDHEAFDLDREEAPGRAIFDPGKEATLARRYEAAAERGLYRALRDYSKLEQAQRETPPSHPFYQNEPLASFRAGDGPPSPPVATPKVEPLIHSIPRQMPPVAPLAPSATGEMTLQRTGMGPGQPADVRGVPISG
jgi:hypothetical protein